MTTKTVLIVDDRASTLKVIRAILEDEGYTVFQATSSEEALQIFHQNDGIEVVLSDMKLPGKNGLELYRLMSGIGNPPPLCDHDRPRDGQVRRAGLKGRRDALSDQATGL